MQELKDHPFKMKPDRNSQNKSSFHDAKMQ